MLEKPRVADEALAARLQQDYGLHVVGLDFLPLGYDANSWVYRVRSARGEDYFLKLHKGAVYEASVAVPRFLKDAGVEQVVAPLPNLSDALWTTVDDFALFLYPYVDGVSGKQASLPERKWVEFGTILKRIHTTRLPAALRRIMRRETFVSLRSQPVRHIHALIEGRTYPAGSVEAELAALWEPRRAEIARLVERTDELGRMARRRHGEFVLCHTDIHMANVLVDGSGGLHVVDWDAPLMAPVERDLMFVTEIGAGAIVRAREEEQAWFFAGYGRVEIDPLAMAYYRYEWAVQEIAAYGAWAFTPQQFPDFGEETRRDGVNSFRGLFRPGDVVACAYRADADVRLLREV